MGYETYPKLLRIGTFVFLMLAAGCAQTPTLAVDSRLEDVLATLVECIDDGIVHRDDRVTAADAVARTIVSGCTAKHRDAFDDLTSGTSVAFIQGFENGLINKATQNIFTKRASRLMS